MSQLRDVVDHAIEQVKSAGITRAYGRLEDVNPPCVWVAVDEVDHTLGALEVTLALFLIPGGPDEYRALDKAGTMLEQLTAAGLSPSSPTRTAQVVPTETSSPLAALRVTTIYTATPDTQE